MDDDDLVELCGISVDCMKIEDDETELEDAVELCPTSHGINQTPFVDEFFESLMMNIFLSGMKIPNWPVPEKGYRAEQELLDMAIKLHSGDYLAVLRSHAAEKVFSWNINDTVPSQVDEEDLKDFPIRFRSVFDDPMPRINTKKPEKTVTKEEPAKEKCKLHFVDRIFQVASAFINKPTDKIFGGSSQRANVLRTGAVLLLGVAAFNLFAQGNYTGPAIEEINGLLDQPLLNFVSEEWDVKGTESLHEVSLHWLVVDGEDIHRHCLHPIFLVAARALLWVATQPKLSPWAVPVTLSESAQSESSGNVSEDTCVGLPSRKRCVYKGCANLRLVQVKSSEHLLLNFGGWMAGRAVVAHARLMNVAKGDCVLTLWEEATSLFEPSLNKYKDTTGRLGCMINLEWGLAKHFFDVADGGKRNFEEAQKASGLRVILTAALGKRTKFQKKAIPQMVVLAASATVELEEQCAETLSESVGLLALQHAQDKPTLLECNTVNVGGEIIPNAALAAAQGVISIQHNAEEILLEQIVFTDQEGAEVDKPQDKKVSNTVELDGMSSDGNLDMLDQAVLLALCLDVANSNPKNGLTSEQMKPYLDRVLQNPNNWMIYSTGLLERSWVEFERLHARERAVLQMQALIDQHSNRLTITQSTTRSVEDSAPVQDRLAFIHQIVYPPRWELKKDVAMRYAGLGVFGSAAAIFEELEMWQEVVECYTHMGQTCKAKQIVEAQLAVRETAAMWSALGDLEQKEEHYIKAWEVSNHRYFKAKRLLARMVFDRGDYEQAAVHYEEALKVKPLVPQAWFTLGVAYMRMEQFEKGLKAFTNVVTQCPEEGDAWGNIGAIHIHLGNLEMAHAALSEAVKQQRESWRLWENMLLVQVALNKWGEAMYTFHRVLDLREKSKKSVDIELLQRILDGVLDPQNLPGSKNDSENNNVNSSIHQQNIYVQQFSELLNRITSIVKTDPEIWSVSVKLHSSLGQSEQVLDSLMKKCRSLTTENNWGKNEEVAGKVAFTVAEIVEARLLQDSSAGLHSCKMYINGLLKRLQLNLPDSENVSKLQVSLAKIEKALSLKSDMSI